MAPSTVTVGPRRLSALLSVLLLLLGWAPGCRIKSRFDEEPAEGAQAREPRTTAPAAPKPGASSRPATGEPGASGEVGRATPEQCAALKGKWGRLLRQRVMRRAPVREVDPEARKALLAFRDGIIAELQRKFAVTCRTRWAADRARCALAPGVQTVEQMSACRSSVDLRPPEQRPTAERCTRLQRHMARLLDKSAGDQPLSDRARQMKQTIVKNTRTQCLEQMTTGEVSCQLKAHATHELSRCEPQGDELQRLLGQALIKLLRPLHHIDLKRAATKH